MKVELLNKRTVKLSPENKAEEIILDWWSDCYRINRGATSIRNGKVESLNIIFLEGTPSEGGCYD